MDYDTIINGLLNVDPSVYALLLGGAVGVSLLTQGAKKLFSLTNEKHVVAVFNLIAVMASGLDYLLTSSNLPPTVLGINTLLITGIATPVYIYAIKPLSIFIYNVNMYKNRVLEKVVAVEAVVTPEVAPSVITTTTTEVTVPTPTIEAIVEPEIIAPTILTADF